MGSVSLGYSTFRLGSGAEGTGRERGPSVTLSTRNHGVGQDGICNWAPSWEERQQSASRGGAPKGSGPALSALPIATRELAGAG